MKIYALLRDSDVHAYVTKIGTVRVRWCKYVHNEEWTNMQAEQGKTEQGKCKTRQSKASSSTSYIHRYYIAVDCGVYRVECVNSEWNRNKNKKYDGHDVITS